MFRKIIVTVKIQYFAVDIYIYMCVCGMCVCVCVCAAFTHLRFILSSNEVSSWIRCPVSCVDAMNRYVIAV